VVRACVAIGCMKEAVARRKVLSLGRAEFKEGLGGLGWASSGAGEGTRTAGMAWAIAHSMAGLGLPALVSL
jgi:hypothetical protein